MEPTDRGIDLYGATWPAPIRCVTLTNKTSIKCGVPQPGVFINGKNFPLLIGVGPAKTSSTAILARLDLHPGILVGNAVWVKRDQCCGSETYFFTVRFNGTHTGEALAAYYRGNPMKLNGPESKWLAEKTPEYADHLLAPYRVAATLEDTAIALLFTVREPLSAHVSLYFYRIGEAKGRTKAVANQSGFVDWSRTLLTRYEEYQRCIEGVLDKLLPGAPPDVRKRWAGVQALDEAIHWECRANITTLEGIESLMYSRTVTRWLAALPGARMICTRHDHFIEDTEAAVEKIFTALSAPAHPASNIPPPLPGRGLIRLAPPVDQRPGNSMTPEERVLASPLGNRTTASEEVREHMQKLKELFANEWEWITAACDAMNEGTLTRKIL